MEEIRADELKTRERVLTNHVIPSSILLVFFQFLKCFFFPEYIDMGKRSSAKSHNGQPNLVSNS